MSREQPVSIVTTFPSDDIMDCPEGMESNHWQTHLHVLHKNTNYVKMIADYDYNLFCKQNKPLYKADRDALSGAYWLLLYLQCED